MQPCWNEAHCIQWWGVCDGLRRGIISPYTSNLQAFDCCIATNPSPVLSCVFPCSKPLPLLSWVSLDLHPLCSGHGSKERKRMGKLAKAGIGSDEYHRCQVHLLLQPPSPSLPSPCLCLTCSSKHSEVQRWRALHTVGGYFVKAELCPTVTMCACIGLGC